MSPFWILFDPSILEVVMTTGAVKHAKLQSKISPQSNQCPAFYRPNTLPVAWPTVSGQGSKGKSFIFCELAYPFAPGLFQPCLWTLKDYCSLCIFTHNWSNDLWFVFADVSETSHSCHQSAETKSQQVNIVHLSSTVCSHFKCLASLRWVCKHLTRGFVLLAYFPVAVG